MVSPPSLLQTPLLTSGLSMRRISIPLLFSPDLAFQCVRGEYDKPVTAGQQTAYPFSTAVEEQTP